MTLIFDGKTSDKRIPGGRSPWTGLFGLIGVCLLFGTGTPAAAAAPADYRVDAPVFELLESTPGMTLVRVRFPVSDPDLDWQDVDPRRIRWREPGPVIQLVDRIETLPPSGRIGIAVPTRQTPTLTLVDIAWRRRPVDASGIDSLYRIFRPRVHRGVPISTLEVQGRIEGDGIPASLVLRIFHPVAASYAPALKTFATAKAAAADRRPDPLILNADLSATLYASQSPGLRPGWRPAVEKAGAMQKAGAFGQSENWLRLEINRTGIHRLFAYQMANAGVALQSVDPAKIRLFRAWSKPLPDPPETPGSWGEDWDGLTEIPLLLDEGDGSWDPADMLSFNAVGADRWRDLDDPLADPLYWDEHPFAGTCVYWLSWEDFSTSSPFTGSPLRLQITASATGGRVIDKHRQRVHLEENLYDASGLVQDNWAWDVYITSPKRLRFDARYVVPGDSTLYKFEFRSRRAIKDGFDSELPNQATGWLNNDDDLGLDVVLDWELAYESRRDTLNLRLPGISPNLVEGENNLYLARTATAAPTLALDCADIEYSQYLIKDFGPFPIYLPGDGFTGASEAVALQISHGLEVEPLLWDVTDPDAPRIYSGHPDGDAGNRHVFGLIGEAGVSRRFLAITSNEMYDPISLRKRNPATLRDMDRDLDHIVIYAPEFATAAQELAAHRSRVLRDLAAPRSTAVSVIDIYDSFGGGVKDPLAIRNFLKWVWIGSGGRLSYACMIGDACRDYRNYLNKSEDFLPTYQRLSFPGLMNDYTKHAYATDDHLVSFENFVFNDPDAPDLAVGRLAVIDAAGAIQRVRRIIEFELEAPPGSWRNRLVMAADDFWTPSEQTYYQQDHTDHAELLVNDYTPLSIDVAKDMLVDFVSDSAAEPKYGSRLLARKLFNDGLSIFHYIGHGSAGVLADEQLFLTDDIFGLQNGMRRGVFMAFSCDVGVYDGFKPSMAEVFVSQADGGTIAAIAASQVSWIIANEKFSTAFYASLFPNRRLDDDIPLGWALMQAKRFVSLNYEEFIAHNSQRYILECDPALSLRIPMSGPELTLAGEDNLRGGHLEMAVMALSDLGLSSSAGVSYDLRVEGCRRDMLAPYRYGVAPQPMPSDSLGYPYWIPGPQLFHGTGDADGDSLKVPFMVPLQIVYGDSARIRLIVDTPEGSWSMPHYLDTVKSATGGNDDFNGPRISLAFEDDRFRVKSGTRLVGELLDPSGISIVGTNPLNSVLLEFDESGYMTNVSENFNFDSGSYSSGQIEINIPDNLEYGPHSVALFASDVLGNVGSDTLSFQLVASSATSIDDVTIFPNPSPSDMRMIFELSDAMDVVWTIFTLAGDRIAVLQKSYSTPGPKILHWDGRDSRGDQPANGVYLYTLHGSWQGNQGPDIVISGQLVIMR